MCERRRERRRRPSSLSLLSLLSLLELLLELPELLLLLLPLELLLLELPELLLLPLERLLFDAPLRLLCGLCARCLRFLSPIVTMLQSEQAGVLFHSLVANNAYDESSTIEVVLNYRS